MPCSAAAVPVPSSTTRLIICASARAVASLHHLALLARLEPAHRAPVAVAHLLDQVRPHQAARRSPIAEATIAICSGVTCRRSCPIATRPMSIASSGPSSLPPRVDAAGAQLVRRAGRSAACGRSRSASCTCTSSYLPSFSPTCAQTVLTECVSAVGEGDRAELLAAEVRQRHAVDHLAATCR